MIGLTKKQIPLACLLVFQNDEESIENTLNAIFESSYPLNVYIVDDGSTDATGAIIESMLAYINREDVQYFRYETMLGRGVRLNEVITSIPEIYFWAPHRISQIDQKSLEVALDILPDYALVHHKNQLFEKEKASLKFFDADSHFLFNKNQIPSFETFFNPFLNQCNALEMAYRIKQSSSVMGLDSWVSANEENLTLDPYTKRELKYSLSRYDNPAKESDSSSKNPKTDSDGEILKSKLINRCKEVLASGNRSLAGEILQILLEVYGETEPILDLKVHFYEKTSRYVEASEVKSQIQKRREENGHAIESGDEEKSEITPNEAPISPTETETLEESPTVISDSSYDENAETNIEPTEESPSDQDEPAPHNSSLGFTPPPFTIIVPTALDGLDAIAHCLAGIDENLSPDWANVVVVDNASLDDTYEFLNNRIADESKLIPLQVISNRTNVGFLASIKQALRSVETDYVIVMHNDVQIQSPAIAQMIKFLRENEEIGAVAACSGATWNEKQLTKEDSDTSDQALFIQTHQLDSFCIAFRKSDGYLWDENFKTAYLEDVDFCYSLQQNGKKVGVLPSIKVFHAGNHSTQALGLGFNSEHYAKQLLTFQKKWNMLPALPESYANVLGVDRLFALAQITDLWAPSESIIKEMSELLTDEVKTVVLQRMWSSPELETLIGVMLIIQQRDILRTLEDKLPLEEISLDMAVHLAKFYFERNIFSRAKHYIKRFATEKDLPLSVWLIQYQILVLERNIEDAVELSELLLNKYPLNPDVYKITADLYKFLGDKENTEAFYGRAHIIDPYRYPEEQYLLD